MWYQQYRSCHKPTICGCYMVAIAAYMAHRTVENASDGTVDNNSNGEKNNNNGKCMWGRWLVSQPSYPIVIQVQIAPGRIAQPQPQKAHSAQKNEIDRIVQSWRSARIRFLWVGLSGDSPTEPGSAGGQENSQGEKVGGKFIVVHDP